MQLTWNKKLTQNQSAPILFKQFQKTKKLKSFINTTLSMEMIPFNSIIKGMFILKMMINLRDKTISKRMKIKHKIQGRVIMWQMNKI